MARRMLLAFCLSFLVLFVGCGGGSGGAGGSYSSSWMGTTPNPDANAPATIDIQPSAVLLQPNQSISLSILVKNNYGHPMDGVNIQLASLLGGKFEDQTGTTAKGWFSTRFTAGKQVGTEGITALANGKMESKSILVQTSAATPPKVTIITSSQSTIAETPVTVAVGATIAGASAEDASVLLSSTIPGSFGDSSGQIKDGWYSTSFKPDSTASGIGTITALVDGIVANASLSVTLQKKEAPQLKVAVNPDAVFQDQSAAVIVTARDANGFPSTAKVYLSASLSGSFSDVSGTPEDGVFFTDFKAEKEVGSATITVFSMGASATTILSIERPTIVAKITPSSKTVKVKEKIPCSVLVTDSFSRPIKDAIVYLSADLGCTVSPTQDETNNDGYLFFTFTASQTAGISNIFAMTAGANASTTVTIVGP